MHTVKLVTRQITKFVEPVNLSMLFSLKSQGLALSRASVSLRAAVIAHRRIIDRYIDVFSRTNYSTDYIIDSIERLADVICLFLVEQRHELEFSKNRDIDDGSFAANDSKNAGFIEESFTIGNVGIFVI